MTDSSEASNRVGQLKRIGFENLSSFRGGLSEMGNLLSRIKSVLSELEAISDDSWITQARRQWGQLEILYALVLEDSSAELTDEERSDANVIISRLTALFRA